MNLTLDVVSHERKIYSGEITYANEMIKLGKIDQLLTNLTFLGKGRIQAKHLVLPSHYK